jgi:hypothetical protein
MDQALRAWLNRGQVIPACPLALTANRKLDERRQRALVRYYAAAGAGGIAVGVHTTQFAIRDAKHGLFRPVRELAAEEFARAGAKTGQPLLRIGGVCGDTPQAVAEAALLRELGYHAGLVSLAALPHASESELGHCKPWRSCPVMGFYLHRGRRPGPTYSFWRRFAELENVVAIKIAPFNRYQTLDVVRAVAEAGREDIALYTGNDDNIVLDLLTPWRFVAGGRIVERRFVGGLLGLWAVWTRKAVELLRTCQAVSGSQDRFPPELLRLAVEVTDANAAFFDAANASAVIAVFMKCCPQGLSRASGA